MIAPLTPGFVSAFLKPIPLAINVVYPVSAAATEVVLFIAYLRVFIVGIFVLAVTAVDVAVLFVTALVVKAAVLEEPDIMTLLAVKDVVLVPPFSTGKVPVTPGLGFACII